MDLLLHTAEQATKLPLIIQAPLPPLHLLQLQAPVNPNPIGKTAKRQ